MLDAVGAIQSGPPATWLRRVQALTAEIDEGAIKTYLIWCALGWRRRWREVRVAPLVNERGAEAAATDRSSR